MRVRVSTGEGVDPMDCPHQFVGRCDECAAAAGQSQLGDPLLVNPWKAGLQSSSARPMDPYGEPPT
jgi:hypothetical protein